MGRRRWQPGAPTTTPASTPTGSSTPAPPSDPDNHAPKRAVPLPESEAFLNDVVQGLPIPHTAETIRHWLKSTWPQAWVVRGMTQSSDGG